MPSKDKKEERTLVATHRKARQFYEILETYEAGLHLRGAEVKSLRQGHASLDGCFGRAQDGEIWLHNFYIPPYSFAAAADAPDPRRARKLLLNATEIRRLEGGLRTKGLALIPLEVYFRRGWAKVALGLARGKTGVDRREDLKKKTQRREAEKSFKGAYRG